MPLLSVLILVVPFSVTSAFGTILPEPSRTLTMSGTTVGNSGISLGSGVFDCPGVGVAVTDGDCDCWGEPGLGVEDFDGDDDGLVPPPPVGDGDADCDGDGDGEEAGAVIGTLKNTLLKLQLTVPYPWTTVTDFLIVTTTELPTAPVALTTQLG